MIEWKQVPGFEYYEASSTGLVRSIDRVVDRIRKGRTHQLPKKGKVITQQIDKQGYRVISINKKGFKIHRLVALAFLDNPDSKRCVNHKDGIKSNNNVNNLEWATHSENIKHAHRTGLKKPQQLGKSGRLHTRSMAILSIKDTAIIEHESKRLCAYYLGVDPNAVNMAVKRGYTCKGHKLYAL